MLFLSKEEAIEWKLIPKEKKTKLTKFKGRMAKAFYKKAASAPFIVLGIAIGYSVKSLVVLLRP
jgi:hypothetical protein